MSKEESRKYFEMYYDLHINDEKVQNKEIAWDIWEKSRIITEMFMKG